MGLFSWIGKKKAPKETLPIPTHLASLNTLQARITSLFHYSLLLLTLPKISSDGFSEKWRVKSEKVKISPNFVRGDFWLGGLDSNQRNARVKVWCLTAWLHPNVLGHYNILISCCQYLLAYIVLKVSKKIYYHLNFWLICIEKMYL